MEIMNETLTGHSISMIIPVNDEGREINRAIENIRSMQVGDSVEIIVVDGNEERETLKFIQDPHVKKKFSPKGRGIQMNAGAAISTGAILLFLHADTLLPANAFQIIITAINSGRFNAGAFTLSFDNCGIPFTLISLSARVRGCLTGIPFGDQGIFITKKLFKKLGGYREIPLMEDIDLMRRVKKEKGRIFISPEKVITSARKWERDGILYTTGKNIIIQILYFSGVSPDTLVRYYYKS